jgi:hypothetical protein
MPSPSFEPNIKMAIPNHLLTYPTKQKNWLSLTRWLGISSFPKSYPLNQTTSKSHQASQVVLPCKQMIQTTTQLGSCFWSAKQTNSETDHHSCLIGALKVGSEFVSCLHNKPKKIEQTIQNVAEESLTGPNILLPAHHHHTASTP